MPKHLPQSTQRTQQIQAHNKRALENKKPEDVLPEQSATRIWEPHEWNAELERRAKARGERPNIVQPSMPKGFVTTTKEPEMRDLRQEQADKAEHIRTGGRKPFKGGLKVEKPD